jgi:cation diffusion facilitator CzcD-associated flavoprotein CzcO
MNNKQNPEKYKVIVIGAGQAGLSAGYYLKKHDIPFIILDANDRVGDSWRNRWDSLRLFTPAKLNILVCLLEIMLEWRDFQEKATGIK